MPCKSTLICPLESQSGTEVRASGLSLIWLRGPRGQINPRPQVCGKFLREAVLRRVVPTIPGYAGLLGSVEENLNRQWQKRSNGLRTSSADEFTRGQATRSYCTSIPIQKIHYLHYHFLKALRSSHQHSGHSGRQIRPHISGHCGESILQFSTCHFQRPVRTEPLRLLSQ